MAVTGTLLVTPDQLTSMSGSFGQAASNVSNTTNNMLNLVHNLGSSWRGDASATYMRKFNALSDDMTRMYKMMQEHSQDLQQMAKNYKQAEDTNNSTANTLREDVVI